MGGPDSIDEKEDDEKTSAPYSTNDYYADYIMHIYRRFQSDSMLMVKLGLVLAGPIAIVLFATMVSSSASTSVAFITMVISFFFIGVSMYILGWILDKDIGPRSMQEIADTIKEGSEGFFKTQYGTIF